MAPVGKRKADRSLLRHLPPVDEVLQALEKGPGARLEPSARTRLARRVLGRLREEIEEGHWKPASRREAARRASSEARDAAARMLGPHPRAVINATGVLLHTNLGRAPLSREAIAAVRKAAEGYSDLEYDLPAGERGSRLARLEEMLCVFTGAEGAMAVNNNAGAVLLALNTLAEGREVIVSRGHLVEIGGSFRMPAIMAKSGCRMVEVGTTNKTYLRDYAEAITRRTALILHVHQSNFAQKGFVKQVPLADLVALGRDRSIPVMDDQGSGIVSEPGRLGAPDEPTVGESLGEGVTLVTSSGDKLLGGPQAGLAMGDRDRVAAMKANPLARALRLDKLQIAALEATLRAYLTGVADAVVPVRVMAMRTQGALKARAAAIRDGIEAALADVGGMARGRGASKGRQPIPLKVGTARSSSVLGGGSSPDVSLPGWAVVLASAEGGLKASDLGRALREGNPPVICRVSEEKVMLEVRSVFPEQDGRLPGLVAAAVARALKRRR